MTESNSADDELWKNSGWKTSLPWRLRTLAVAVAVVMKAMIVLRVIAEVKAVETVDAVVVEVADAAEAVPLEGRQRGLDPAKPLPLQRG